MDLTAVYIKVPDGYVAFVEEMPSASTQAATLEAARDNLKEAVHSVLVANRQQAERSIAGWEVTKESFAVSLS